MKKYIRQGAKVKIEAVGLDGSIIHHTMKRAVATLWTQQKGGEVLALVRTRGYMDPDDDPVEPWRVLVSPDDLYDPYAEHRELDRSLVVLNLLSEVASSLGSGGRVALTEALRTLINHDIGSEDILEMWRRSGEECEGLSARCVRMRYKAHEAIDREEEKEETYIADRLLTLSGPRQEKR